MIEYKGQVGRRKGTSKDSLGIRSSYINKIHGMQSGKDPESLGRPSNFSSACMDRNKQMRMKTNSEETTLEMDYLSDDIECNSIAGGIEKIDIGAISNKIQEYERIISEAEAKTKIVELVRTESRQIKLDRQALIKPDWNAVNEELKQVLANRSDNTEETVISSEGPIALEIDEKQVHETNKKTSHPNIFKRIYNWFCLQ
ncbi:hypothetical protein ENBRE01_0211 [Enteropsectra breve]|nr:hypothetical protein ENBRE01_0211 [Enteropsectra breve]